MPTDLPLLPDLALQWEPEVAHTLRLTLDRPDARNAYSEAMVDSLCAALDFAEEHDEVRVLVLTGAGSAFSAGGDLKAMRDHSGMFEGDATRLRARYLRGIQRIPRRMARFHKPVIAAVNGPAVGAGLDLACMADIRVAADSARFGSTFVKVGLIPGDGGAWLLARTIGFPRAMELVLSGRLIDAQEALSLGLVHELHPADALDAAVRQHAARLAANPPLAQQLAKALMLRSWELPLDAALDLAATFQGVVQNSADHDEAVAAFLERRPPRYKGR